MAQTKTLIINVKTSEAQKDVQNLNSEIKKTNKEVDNTSKSASVLKNNLDSITGGAVTKFSNFRKSVGSLTTGFKSLRVAIIGTGIGALLIAITSIIQAFKRSEEGQNKFAKLLGVIGSITNNLLDLLGDLGDLLIDAFSNPQEAISKLGRIIKENLQNSLDGLFEFIPKLGEAIKKLFEGEFSEAAKIATDAAGKVAFGVESITDSTQNAINKTKEFVAELEREARIAAQIADQRAKADVIERNLIVQRAEADRRIAELREKSSRSDLFSLSERRKALIEASEINQKITDQEIEAARIRRDTLIEENKISESNKDALKAEEEAKAAVIKLETQRLNLQKRLGTELASLNKQAAAQSEQRRKQQEQENAKTLLEEQKRLEGIQKLREKFVKDQENLDDTTEEQKLERERERAQRELDQLIGTETEKREAQIALNLLFDQKERELEDLRDQEREARRKQRIDQEIKDEETKQKALDDIQKAELKNVADGIGLLKSLAGENKKLQAAAVIAENARGIAETIINTQKANLAVTAKYAGIPGGQGLAALEIGANKKSAAISIATSILATRKALSTLGGGGSAGSSNGASASGGGGEQTQAPAFNLIGQGGGINQIAESLQQEQQPIQAFVVSGNVSSAQELDRNIIESATIG